MMTEHMASVASDINREADAEFENTRYRSYSYRDLGDAPTTTSRQGIDRLMENVLSFALEAVEFDDQMDELEALQVMDYLTEEADLQNPDGAVVTLPEGFLQIHVAKSYLPDKDEGSLTAVTHAHLSMATPSGSFGARLAIFQEIDHEKIQCWTRRRGVFGELLLISNDAITPEWLDSNPAAAALLEAMGNVFPIRVPGEEVQSMFDQSTLALGGMTYLAEQIQDTKRAQSEADGLRRDLAMVTASRDAARRRADVLDMELSQAKAKLLARPAMPVAATAGGKERQGEDAQDQVSQLVAQLERQRTIAEDRQAENDGLRKELYELQRSLNVQINLRAAAPTAVNDYPAEFSHLEQWALDNLQGRVVLHPKAIAAAADSNYQNPAKVYACLQALAELYWPMLFDAASRDPKAWETRCAELGVECSKVGTAATDARTADYYTVTHEGRRLVADMHLRGNSSFDSRYGFRCYFTRDDVGRTLVVTSLPGHLPSRIS